MTDVLRGAVVGYGFIAVEGHVPAFGRPGSGGDGVAVADVCAARRALAAAALPGARIYADHLEMLAGEAGRLDFVDVATPPSEHAGIAHAALDRGLHVLCEKPLTT